MRAGGYTLMKHFRDDYASRLQPPVTVLDVGSRYFGRAGISPYRKVFIDPFYKYTGMDVTPGNNVDIVGFEKLEQSYDCVISTYTMEHVKRPWDWLKRLVPLFKSYICIIAPSEHPEHRYPFDTYRYMPDGMVDLFDYAGIKVLRVLRGRREVMGIGGKL